MTTADAKRTILVSLVMMVAIAAVRDLGEMNLPRPRIVIGAFGAAIMLNLLAGPAPRVAGGLALTAVVASALSEEATIKRVTRLFDKE